MGKMAGLGRSATLVLATIVAAGLTLSQSFFFVPVTSARGLIRSHNERQMTNLQYRPPHREVFEARQLTMKRRRRGGAGKPSVQQIIDELRAEQGPIPTDPTKVMVSRLDESWSEDDVKEFCSAAGSVVSVKLISKKNAKRNKRRGFAFVEFDHEETASRATRQLKFTPFQGLPVDVKLAHEDRSVALAAYMKWESEHPEKVAEAKAAARTMSVATYST